MLVAEVLDKYNVNYVVFYMIGICTTISKNFFITATDYWMYKFRDANNTSPVAIADKSHRTDLQAEFIASFSVTANTVHYVFVALAMIFARKINVEKQIIGSILVTILCFLLTMAFVNINTDDWQREFMYIQLAIGGLLTAACGVITVNTFQISVKFPPEYLVACMSGHAVCGISSAIIQIICLAMSDWGSEIVAFTYFTIGLFFVCSTLIGFIGIKCYSAFYIYHSTKETKSSTTTEEKKEALAKRVKNVAMKIKWYLLALYLTTSATTILEPGVTSLIVSENAGHGNKWNDIFFVPVTTFLMFHFFDWVGRESSARIQWPKDGRIILVISILRIGLIPLFMYCNLHPRHNLPVIFQSDLIYILFIVLLAFTTGYCCISSIYHSGRVTDETDKKITSNLTLITLVAGVLSFSSLNILVVRLL